MTKRFAEIDSNFSAAITAINAYEQTTFVNGAQDLSNRVLKLDLSSTNTEADGRKLEKAVNWWTANTTVALLQDHANCQARRAEATNEMLLEKLAWYYTNSAIPSAPVPKDNDVALSISNLSNDLFSRKNAELVSAGLLRIVEEMSNSIPPEPAPDSPDEIARKKKSDRMAEIERERQSSAVQLAQWRESDGVKKTGVTMSGEVFQITGGGMLVKYNVYGYDYDLAFIQDCNTDAFADGQPFRASVLYPIGTYRYDTAAGSFKTVKRFTADLSRAVQWHRSPWCIARPQNLIGFFFFPIGQAFHQYLGHPKRRDYVQGLRPRHRVRLRPRPSLGQTGRSPGRDRGGY
jgi:hypothetical protein